MDRKFVTRMFAPFTLDKIPEWACPTCEKGILTIKKESFFKDEPVDSRDHSDKEWSPEYIRYVYSCLLYCSNPNCHEVVTCTGSGNVRCDYNEENKQLEYCEEFCVKFFEPPLRIISIPKNCPEEVKSPLIESFRQIFSSPNASANSVRIALDNLLTDLGIIRYSNNNLNGKKNPINLHDRIDKIPIEYSGIKDIILAVKWIGNAGSHSIVNISTSDVLDAYLMLEHLLHEIYGTEKEDVKKIAKEINENEGPR
ncbi:MAG: DUF4145 domain-containing protein [Deinococcaceae bacterium]